MRSQLKSNRAVDHSRCERRERLRQQSLRAADWRRDTPGTDASREVIEKCGPSFGAAPLFFNGGFSFADRLGARFPRRDQHFAVLVQRQRAAAQHAGELTGELSEARFVESRIHARAARYGNLRIQQELAQHGVAPDDSAREQLKASELSRAREVWRRKFGAPAAGAAERAKQMRFLAQRGFSAEVIRRVVAGGEDD